MDYTDIPRVRGALGAQENVDDAILEGKITEASRTLDQVAVGLGVSNVADYFQYQASIVEDLRAIINSDGQMVCYPRKPEVTGVGSFQYRATPLQSWLSVNVAHVEYFNGVVQAWGPFPRGRYTVRLDYSGGLGATLDDLPADLINAATVMAVRLYREEKSGLTDTIGVAELGTLQYTAALPTRVVKMMQPYRRMYPW